MNLIALAEFEKSPYFGNLDDNAREAWRFMLPGESHQQALDALWAYAFDKGWQAAQSLHVIKDELS